MYLTVKSSGSSSCFLIFGGAGLALVGLSLLLLKRKGCQTIHISRNLTIGYVAWGALALTSTAVNRCKVKRRCDKCRSNCNSETAILPLCDWDRGTSGGSGSHSLGVCLPLNIWNKHSQVMLQSICSMPWWLLPNNWKSLLFWGTLFGQVASKLESKRNDIICIFKDYYKVASYIC